VLRDTLDAGRGASDLLLPRTDLTALFPAPAAEWIAAHGGNVLTGRRVSAIDPAPEGYTVRHAAGASTHTHVILAVAPHQVQALLPRLPELGGVAQAIERFAYQPIYSIYLQYPPAVRLATPMLGFESALLQWGFDRGALCGQDGLLGLVISADGMHEEHPHDALAPLVHQELQQQIGPLPGTPLVPGHSRAARDLRLRPGTRAPAESHAARELPSRRRLHRERLSRHHRISRAQRRRRRQSSD
jgi:hypothetical protein